MTDQRNAKGNVALEAAMLASGSSGGFIGVDGDDLHVPPLLAWLRWRLQDILQTIRVQLPAITEVAGRRPQPDPWHTAVAVKLGRAIADRAIALQLDGAAIGGETERAHASAAASFVNAFVDDYCGTPPRRKLPWPHGGDYFLTPAEQLLVASQLLAGGRLGGIPALVTAAGRIAAH